MLSHLRDIAAAAARLDKERLFWWRKVDLKKLDMFSRSDCIIGQVYGYFVDKHDDWWRELGTIHLFGDIFCNSFIWKLLIRWRRFLGYFDRDDVPELAAKLDEICHGWHLPADWMLDEDIHETPRHLLRAAIGDAKMTELENCCCDSSSLDRPSSFWYWERQIQNRTF